MLRTRLSLFEFESRDNPDAGVAPLDPGGNAPPPSGPPVPVTTAPPPAPTQTNPDPFDP